MSTKAPTIAFISNEQKTIIPRAESIFAIHRELTPELRLKYHRVEKALHRKYEQKVAHLRFDPGFIPKRAEKDISEARDLFAAQGNLTPTDDQMIFYFGVEVTIRTRFCLDEWGGESDGVERDIKWGWRSEHWGEVTDIWSHWEGN